MKRSLLRSVCLCGLAVILCAGLLFVSGCGKSEHKFLDLAVAGSYTDASGSEILKYQATKLEAWPETKDVNAGMILTQSLTNNGKDDITSVAMMLNFEDAEGNDLFSVPVQKTFSSDPLKPGETRSINLDRDAEKAMEIANLTVDFLRVLTDSEAPSWKEPLPHNSLFVFCNDDAMTKAGENVKKGAVQSIDCTIKSKTEGAVSVAITDPNQIDGFLQALSRMEIGEKTELEVTGDYDFSYKILFNDYSSITLNFQTQQVFTWHGSNYVVLNDGGLFRFDPAGK